MNIKKVMKSNQEQAVGAWVDYLNQIRLNNLVMNLSNQEKYLTKAIDTIDLAFETIKESIIDSNRGGYKGMHGFIAEIAECGIGNARKQINGYQGDYLWVDDNGPVDLVRNGINIQQKFVNSGNHLSLKAISQHLSKYPDYIENGGLYQIPENHYERINYLINLPKEVANKMSTSDGEFSLKQWKEVNDFFENGDISIDKIEASKLSYASVQANKIQETLESEKIDLKNKNNLKKDIAYDKSKPSLSESIKVAGISGLIEGGTSFFISVAKNRRNGKKLKDFDSTDWQKIVGDTSKGFIKGNVRGTTIYTLTNYTATPAAVASSIVTASFAVAEQTHLFRQGHLSEIEFLERSELLCLDASVSALSSLVGQVIIPLPVLGAVIGNTVGTMMYQIGKDKFSKKEQNILESYVESLRQLDDSIEEEYQKTIDKLMKDIEIYMMLLDDAFNVDPNLAFDGSIKLAQYFGVPVHEILDSTEKIELYFQE